MPAFHSLGVDLASQPKDTAVCLLEWGDHSACIQELGRKYDDARLVQLASVVQAVGIDAPFGWPRAFVDAVVGAGTFAWPHPPGWPDTLRDRLRYRRTDLHLKSLPEKLQPLSVSSELLGVTAMRCAGLLQGLGVQDRSGQAGIFEVYPEASLRRWGLKTKGYKNKENAHLRAQLL